MRDLILPYLEEFDCRISASGIRYGSVAYIAFGRAREKPHKGRPSTFHYPVEIEMGSDYWTIERNGEILLDSCFSDVDRAREKLQVLNGRKLCDIDIQASYGVFELDDGISWISSIISRPASGYLYSFQAENGPTWETLDGVSVQQ